MKILILSAQEKNHKNQDDFLKYFRENFNAKIDIIELPSKSIFIRLLYCKFQTLRNLTSINSYDLVLSTSTLNGLTLAFLQKILNGLIKPKHIMIDIALLRMFNKSNKYHQKIAHFLFSSLDKILCYSNIQRNALIQLLGFQDKIEFIPFGIDTNKFQLSNKSQGDYILCVGRAGRDYKTLLKAIENIDVKLIIVTGEDPLASNKELKRNSYNIIKVLNEVSYSEYLELMANSLFIILTLEDTIYPTGQTVLLESMAMGKAVIATRTSGTVDYIEDNVTGIFVEPCHAEDLRQKISFLYENPKYTQKIGINAKNLVEKEFSLNFSLKIIKDKILRVLNASET